jgi:hypothetical protein
VTESGEACDDGNSAWGDTCYKCQKRFYFILNAPSYKSAGDDSIIRVTRSGLSDVILEPKAALAGMRRLAVDSNGAQLYALQSNYSLSIHRLKFINLVNGNVVDLDLDQTLLGYQATPNALAVGINGRVYVEVETSANVSHIVSFHPTTRALIEEMSYSAASVAARDMVQGSNGDFFLTGYYGTFRVSVPYKTWSKLTVPVTETQAIDYDEKNNALVITKIASPAGTLYRQYLSGAGTSGLWATLKTSDIQVRGVYVEPDGTPLVTQTDTNVVGSVASDGTFTAVWKSTSGLNSPFDVDAVTLGN